MTTVYKLHRYDMGKYSHGIPRTEDWLLRRVFEAKNAEEAQEFIEKNEQQESEFIRITTSLTKEEKEVFIKDWCLNDKYYSKRTYFMGDKKQIRKDIIACLRKDGVTVIET